ncbi:phosphatidylcholine/phosphatidylserine synthase, partial [Pseudomonas syringae]
FCFCNVDMKSKDNSFQGFPAAWNVGALCLYILSPAPWLSFIAITALALMTLPRMKFLNPCRVRRFMPLNIAVTTVWSLSSALLLINHPHNGPVVMGLWPAMSAYYMGICLWSTSLDWLGRLTA